ncbi:MAG: hypothetical protein FGM24_06075 [Candidatus Kapabacteria bacterium]|nr:hypothetical protein [Candidatus Kapabacteria bacterium]
MLRIIAAFTIVVLTITRGSIGVCAADSASVRKPMTKSPTTAILMSMALPGLGQYYTESYWKIPLFAGGAAASAWLIVDNHVMYRDADAAYLAAVNSNASSATVQRLLRQREAYRDNRDVATLALAATYVVAAIDAYVGAHLFDFDVSDDVSLNVGPTPLAPVRLSLVARF